MPVARREWLPLALGAVAVAILIAALAVRPQSLPPGSANFGAAVQVAPSLIPVSGKTYAIDQVIAGDTVGTPVAPVDVPAGVDVHVTGWVLDPRTLAPIDHLLVRIDGGTPISSLNVHMDRPDVADALGIPGATASGFDVRIPTKSLRAGDHTLSFAAVAKDRRAFALPTAATITIVKG
jgi:hypothetical protein